MVGIWKYGIHLNSQKVACEVSLENVPPDLKNALPTSDRPCPQIHVIMADSSGKIITMKHKIGLIRLYQVKT